MRPQGLTRFVCAILLVSGTASVVHGAEASGLALAIKAGSRGQFRQPAMVEVEGFFKDRYQAVRVFSSEVGIVNNHKQFLVAQDTVKSIFKALDRSGFASMPEQFGGKPRPTHKPELRSAVTVRLGLWEKTVIQMRDGEQSKSFAKLVKRIFAILEGPMSQGVSVANLSEGLKAVLEGTLAPETLSLSLAWEEQPRAFAVFTVSGLYARWTPPGGGQVRRYWLGAQDARELAELLLSLEPNQRSARFYWPKQVSLEVEVLNHRWGIEGRPWAGPMGDPERALARRWEVVEQELRRILKEAMLER